MPFYTYMLKCSDDSFYVGHTDNIDHRLLQHQSGKFDGYTATRLPIKLVWIEKFETRDDAFNYERKLKGWSRKKKEFLIVNNWEAISKYCSRAHLIHNV